MTYVDPYEEFNEHLRAACTSLYALFSKENQDAHADDLDLVNETLLPWSKRHRLHGGGLDDNGALKVIWGRLANAYMIQEWGKWGGLPNTPRPDSV